MLVKLDELTKITIDHLLVIGEKLASKNVVFSLEKTSKKYFGKVLCTYYFLSKSLFLKGKISFFICVFNFLFTGNFYKTANNSMNYQKISPGKATFTQEEVNQGLILYKHSDNTSSNFIMNMKVSKSIFY